MARGERQNPDYTAKPQPRVFKKGERVYLPELDTIGVIVEVAFHGWKPLYQVKLDDPKKLLDLDEDMEIDGAFVRTAVLQEAPADEQDEGSG